MRRLCATVLAFEMVVIVLAAPVAVRLEHTAVGPAWWAAAVLAVIALVLAGLVGRPRHRWALVAGSVFQLAVIATGLVVPVMYALGVIFAALWITGIWLARRYQVS